MRTSSQSQPDSSAADASTTSDGASSAAELCRSSSGGVAETSASGSRARAGTRAKSAVAKDYSRIWHLEENPLPPQFDSTMSKRRVEDHYDIGSTLGRGAFSTVHSAIHKNTRKWFAIKAVKIDENFSKQDLWNEINMWMHLRHTNIVQWIDFFMTADTGLMVMDAALGGTVHSDLLKQGKYTEDDARLVVWQIGSALSYLHNFYQIVHRDLKIENLLLKQKRASGPLHVLICDFGASTKCTDRDRLNDMVGTIPYISPEVTSGHAYGKAVDLWHLGVILYMLVTGHPPFRDFGKPTALVLAEIVEDRETPFASFEWSHVSRSCLALCRALLIKRPEKRATLRHVSTHAWLSLFRVVEPSRSRSGSGKAAATRL